MKKQKKMKTIEELEERIAELEDKLEDLEIDNERLKDEIEDLEEDIEDLEEDIEELQEEETRLNDLLDEYESKQTLEISNLEEEQKAELLVIAHKKFTLAELEEKLGGNSFTL